MRPILYGDVVCAARALLELPEAAQRVALRAMLARAAAADAYRKRFGRVHPDWGNGSLMGVARRRPLRPEPALDDPFYCRCLSLVFEELAAWRAEKSGSSRWRR